MSRACLYFVCLIGLFAVSMAPLSAQEPSPTPEDLTLRPNDTITWSPAGSHRLRFGGTVTHGGAALTLTPFADVQKVLTDFIASLTVGADGVALGGVATKVTAKVRDDAATSGVAEFFFTCGFPPHAGMMVSVPFKIAPAIEGQAPRTVQIVSADPPRWVIRIDKKLTRP